MATTITSPAAPTPASGQQNVEPYAEIKVGDPFPDVAGASTTAAGNIKVEYSGEEMDAIVTVVAASNAYTTQNKASIYPQLPGIYSIKVTDVTAGESVTAKVEVFESA